jgi:FAD/FMN-containing dehydrogenase
MEERFAIGKNLQTYKPFIDLDVSFGLNTAKSAIIALKELLTQHNFENIFFGHAGDGNWHIHVFFNDDRAKWDACLTKFDLIVRQYQGFISGEHGIGRIHTNRFRKVSSPTDQALYKSIKQTLDPNHQLPSFY